MRHSDYKWFISTGLVVTLPPRCYQRPTCHEHSTHVDRRFLCSQIDPPKHSTHDERCRLCSHRLPPSHLMQRERYLPWVQKDLPPQSRHCVLTLPWVQRPAPPHGLHVYLSIPCSQRDEPPHSWHREVRFPCSQLAVPLQSRQSRAFRSWIHHLRNLEPLCLKYPLSPICTTVPLTLYSLGIAFVVPLYWMTLDRSNMINWRSKEDHQKSSQSRRKRSPRWVLWANRLITKCIPS